MILVTSVMQGQTIPKEEVTGTWQVIGVVEEGTYPGQGEEMIGSFFDLYPDHNFQLRKDLMKYSEILLGIMTKPNKL